MRRGDDREREVTVLRLLVPIALSALWSACVGPTLQTAELTSDAGPYVCSPTTCTGCCSGNTCLGGNLDDACGYSGRECKTCPARTQCLSPGACISVASDAGEVEPRSDGGAAPFGGLTDPLTGGPLMPPDRKCVWVFGFPVCN
jgi:hypothetical protein